IIHFDSPKVADVVDLPANLGGVVLSAVAHCPGVEKTIVLKRVVNDEPFATALLGVDVTGSGPSRISPLLDWNALTNIWWEGDVGGPEPSGLPVTLSLSSRGLEFFVPALK